jgi:hypothetical protein
MQDERHAAGIKRLHELEEEAAAIRRELKISEPGAVLYQRTLDIDRELLVIADGMGGATLLVIDGDYPNNCNYDIERGYPTEAEATAAAEDWHDEE